MLAEAKPELMKQECKVDSLNTCTHELQRQVPSQRVELDDARCGEQGQLQEELVMKEKALRDTQMRSIHSSGIAS